MDPGVPQSTMLLVVLAASVAGCSSKPSEVTVDELGVALTVPSDWARTKRSDGIAFVHGLDGVLLRKEPHAIKTIDDARNALIVGAKIHEERQLPTGGFFFHFDVDYGTKDKPMVLPHIEVLLPTAGGTITCELQLQPSQDAAPIANACSSMHAK